MPPDAAVRDFLLSHPYPTSALAAVVAGAVVWWLWRAVRPFEDPADRDQVILPVHPPRPATAAAQPLLRLPTFPTVGPAGVPRDTRNRTPYQIVGGKTIRAVVDDFYAHVCADPDLAEFFDAANMTRLKMHQTLFVEHLWGGPAHFPTQRLIEAHQDLYIDPDHYWRLCGHLMVTLTRLRIADWICVFTMTRLYQARTLIISPEPEPSAPPAAPPEE